MNLGKRCVCLDCASAGHADSTLSNVDGGVEPYWGLFTADRALKDITIPDVSLVFVGSVCDKTEITRNPQCLPTAS